MHRFIFMFVAVLMTSTSAWSQDDQRNRSRDARGLAAPQGREGGIPRGQLQRGDGQAEASREGTEEGMPKMQTRRGDSDRRMQPYLIPGPDRPGGDRWVLGVHAYNTETGVVVTRVVPGSAASRTGLEPGDRIVTVDGFQVGFVGDLLYPLGEELQRRAGRGGQVGLLIQNVRTGGLLNRTVRLQQRFRDRFPSFPRPGSR
jgi:hypothetical protein